MWAAGEEPIYVVSRSEKGSLLQSWGFCGAEVARFSTQVIERDRSCLNTMRLAYDSLLT